MRCPGPPGPLGGKTYIPVAQRERLLDAALGVVVEGGYEGFRPRVVCELAGMSPKTFYDLFADREECFLALIDRELERLAGVVRLVYECESEWVERIRSGLGTLLAYLDTNLAVCELLFVAALDGGARVRERRVGVLGVLARAIEADRAGSDPGGWSSSLLAEGVVGGAFTVIHTRVVMADAPPLLGLLEELTAAIVLLYGGAGEFSYAA